MMKPALPVALLAATLATACGSKSDANEENFGAAVSQYLDKHGALCLTLLQWPTDIPVDQIELSKVMKRVSPTKSMDSLVAAGVVSVSDADVDQLRYDGKPSGRTYKVKRYVVSEAGRKYYRARPTSAVAGSPAQEAGDLCFGKQALDKVVRWDLPTKLGDHQETGVTYTYKINDLAEWAMSPAVQQSYPGIQDVIASAGKLQKTHGLKLTNQGWVANGL